MDHRRKKLSVNSVLNFRRVTHFWLCLLETQVSEDKREDYYNIFFNMVSSISDMVLVKIYVITIRDIFGSEVQ